MKCPRCCPQRQRQHLTPFCDRECRSALLVLKPPSSAGVSSSEPPVAPLLLNHLHLPCKLHSYNHHLVQCHPYCTHYQAFWCRCLTVCCRCCRSDNCHRSARQSTCTLGIPFGTWLVCIHIPLVHALGPGCHCLCSIQCNSERGLHYGIVLHTSLQSNCQQCSSMDPRQCNHRDMSRMPGWTCKFL